MAPLADARPGTADARAADARRFDAPPGTPDAKGDAATPDAPLNQECDPSRPTQCDGDVLVTCSTSGTILDTETCTGFCQPNAQGGARCAVLVPSNLPTNLCDAPAERPRIITADVEIVTDTCSGGHIVAQSGGGGEICLLEYTHFAIEYGVLVSARGSLPLAIAADTMALAGILDVSAVGAASGPGSSDKGLGTSSDGAYANAGGGAGFGTTGARGGTEDNLVYVAGGPAYGNQELVPLVGGSPGGRAGVTPSLCTVNCPTIAAGGGGGGALQLVGCTSIDFMVLAQVLATGGGGDGGFQAVLPGGTTLSSAGGGGGGGSGGAILVESPHIDVGIAAFLAATGGGGGGGGGLDQGENGGDGEGGQPDRAAFGGGRGSPYAGRGGAGGTEDDDAIYGVPPVDGEPTQLDNYGAGAGGGAAGRIRFNTAPSSPLDPRSFIVLPYPSMGTISGH